MVLDDVYRSIGVGDDLLDKHPAVVEISMRRGRSDLLHAPVKVVVARPPMKTGSMVNLCHFSARMFFSPSTIDQMSTMGFDPVVYSLTTPLKEK